MTVENVASEQPPVGIDLGTTYSVIAYLDTMGRPTTILNQSGELLTPSAIAFEDGGVIVGKEAVKCSMLEPGSFADCFKRDIGRRFFRRSIGHLEVPPEILSALVLDRLKRDAERRLGPIRKVVITVPAFFDERRRKATQEAGRLAGLDVLDIINEPTAAAVAFGYQQATLRMRRPGGANTKQRILVYDLGGGTFDATILEIDGWTFRTLATDGDVQLGGKDFDERLVNFLAERFMDAQGVDPRSDPHDAAQLWIEVQQAKHTLSERQKASVVCVHAGIRMRIDISRAQFEELTQDLLERTETTTRLLLRDAKVDWDDLDRILLVGGSSRMPMVTAMLRRISGKEPDRSQSADEAIAHGAALYAGMLMRHGNSDENKIKLVNVNSHSLGIVGIDLQTGRKANAILIPKNSPLPCRATTRCKTAHEDQSSVRVCVVEGESQSPEHCIELGECIIRGLPPGLPKGTIIEVEYQYAANGRISVTARVPVVRQSATVTLHQHTEELADLETWRKRLTDAPLVNIGQEPALDRAAVLKQLDELCIRVAGAVGRKTLPDALEKARKSALSATASAKVAKTRLDQVLQEKEAAVSKAEIIQADGLVAQRKQALQQAATQARYAQVALGRECLRLGYKAPGMDRELAEIERLQKHLETMS